MKPEEDAVGQEMWARYIGRKSFEVTEREDGYIDAMDTKYIFLSIKKSSERRDGRLRNS